MIKKQYALIGYPLGHSFSKKFFTQKFESESIHAQYCNYEIENLSELQTIIDNNPSLEGFNVTIPHKENIIASLDSMSKEAKEIAAVNVVKIVRDGNTIQLKGYNSDVIGFVNSIKPLLHGQLHQKALVLGTGGASKAIVYGLKSLGLHSQLVSRKKTKDAIAYEELTSSVLEDYRVIVNCTPLGTFPNVEDAAPIPYQFLTPAHLLYDLVYNPEETEFLKRGKTQGAQIKNGGEMLRLQALEAWRIWNE